MKYQAIPHRPAILIAMACTAICLTASASQGQTLSGSATSIERQSRGATRNDYSYLKTPGEIRRFVAAGLLVPLQSNSNYVLAGVSHPVARPEVRLFVERLAGQYRRACGERLVVTSLTRPLVSQPDNASSRSVHPTGMAIDLRLPTTRSCRVWLEETLLELEAARVLEATRETSPPHLHVAVFPARYAEHVARLTGQSVDRVLARARAARR